MDVRQNIENGKYTNPAPYPVGDYRNAKNKDALFKERQVWQVETYRLETKVFVADLREEFGLSEKVAEKIFEFAWREGHSGGLLEVYNWYAELVDFIKDVKEAW